MANTLNFSRPPWLGEETELMVGEIETNKVPTMRVELTRVVWEFREKRDYYGLYDFTKESRTWTRSRITSGILQTAKKVTDNTGHKLPPPWSVVHLPFQPCSPFVQWAAAKRDQVHEDAANAIKSWNPK